MIRNDKELAVVRKQLALIEHALEALRQREMHPRQFEVFSEGYVDQIAELKAEIDSYRPAAEKKDPADGKRKTAWHALISRRAWFGRRTGHARRRLRACHQLLESPPRRCDNRDFTRSTVLFL